MVYEGEAGVIVTSGIGATEYQTFFTYSATPLACLVLVLVLVAQTFMFDWLSGVSVATWPTHPIEVK